MMSSNNLVIIDTQLRNTIKNFLPRKNNKVMGRGPVQLSNLNLNGIINEVNESK